MADHSHSHSDHHGHDHDHSHVPTVTKENERKILISFFIIFIFMVVEAVGGVISGSLALLADAGHMLTDAIALGLAYVAFRLGRRVADSQRTFGYARFEVIAGLINALTLFGIVAWIVYEAIERFQEPQPVMAGSMFVVAIIGMLVNLFVLWYLTRGDSDHVNVKGAVLHVMGDLLGSVGALLAGVGVMYTGWLPIDPLLSLLIGILVLSSSVRLLREVLQALLEGVPEHLSAEEIGHALTALPGVRSVHDLHIWTLSSNRIALSAHLVVESMAFWPDTLSSARVDLRRRGIVHVTLQPEPVTPVGFRTHRVADDSPL